MQLSLWGNQITRPRILMKQKSVMAKNIQRFADNMKFVLQKTGTKMNKIINDIAFDLWHCKQTEEKLFDVNYSAMIFRKQSNDPALNFVETKFCRWKRYSKTRYNLKFCFAKNWNKNESVRRMLHFQMDTNGGKFARFCRFDVNNGAIIQVGVQINKPQISMRQNFFTPKNIQRVANNMKFIYVANCACFFIA